MIHIYLHRTRISSTFHKHSGVCGFFREDKEPHQKPVQPLCLQHGHNSSSVTSGGCGEPFHLALSGGQHKQAQVLLERVHVPLFAT